jgi:hypothetical protein
MTKSRMTNLIATEYRECEAFYSWAQLNPILKEMLIHHVNEGKRTRFNGYKLKMIGMRKGVLDYQLPVPNKRWCGLWLEMKTTDKRYQTQPVEQKEWIEKLLKYKHYATFAFGWEDAARITTAYLEDKI